MALPTESKTVLAIGAHPDDVEFLCAGTLVLLKERGWRIAVATMTSGDLGSMTLPREEIARVRSEEARASAELLGAEYRCLGWPDFTIFLGDELCRRVTGLIRATRPDVVLTHCPYDYLADHEETSRIVRLACFAAPVRNYESCKATRDEPAIPRIPHLYYCDPIELVDIFGRVVETSLIVDISSVIETKQRLLATHASQRDWLRVQHGCDHYVENMRAWSARRGQQVGCTFGEGLRQHLGHAYPRGDLLREALGFLAHVPSSRPTGGDWQ